MKRSPWATLAVIAIVASFAGVNPPVTGYVWVTPYHQAIYFGGVRWGAQSTPNLIRHRLVTRQLLQIQAILPSPDDSPCDGNGNTIATSAVDLLVGEVRE